MSWPGNVSELENFIEKLAAISARPEILPDDIVPPIKRAKTPEPGMQLGDILKEKEKEQIFSTLSNTKGKKGKRRKSWESAGKLCAGK